MTFDDLTRRLLALSDVALAVACVALVGAIAVHVLVARRLAVDPILEFELVAPASSAPVAELLIAHLRALLLAGGGALASSRAQFVLSVHASVTGIAFRIAGRGPAIRRLGATIGTMWPRARLVPASPPLAGVTFAIEWRPHAHGEHGGHMRVPEGAELTLARALLRAEVGEELSYELILRPAAARTRRPIWDLRQSELTQGRARNDGRSAASQRPFVDELACRVVVRARASTPLRARSLVRELEPTVHVLCHGTPIDLGAARRIRKHAAFAGADGRLGIAELAALIPLPAVAAAVAASSDRPDARGERLLGVRSVGRQEQEVRLSLLASRHHLHVLGPTGTGKSTLLLNLIGQDIAAGRGCAVLDPKGDLVRDLLGRIPRKRLGDVLYIGPDEKAHAVGMNPLALGPDEDPHLAAENALAIFKRIYEENWGPRTDDVLKACLLTLVGVPGTTLGHIPALLTDPALRRRLTVHVDDPVGVGSFWRWYERLSEAKRLEVTAPLQNKLRDFLIRPRLRHLLCQATSSVDLRSFMDRGGILLADLGTGRWGENASALAGSFLVARLWQAALSRQSQRESERRDHLLYMDEFQSFLGIGGPFADALAQARGLRLSLTIANQHLGQLPREIREAVAANARSRIAFRCSGLDAPNLAPDFVPLDADALVALRPFEAAVRLPSAGGAFTVRTLPLAAAQSDVARADEVLATSAARYGRDVAAIDARLRELLSSSDAAEEASHERMK